MSKIKSKKQFKIGSPDCNLEAWRQTLGRKKNTLCILGIAHRTNAAKSIYAQTAISPFPSGILNSH